MPELRDAIGDVVDALVRQRATRTPSAGDPRAWKTPRFGVNPQGRYQAVGRDTFCAELLPHVAELLPGFCGGAERAIVAAMAVRYDRHGDPNATLGLASAWLAKILPARLCAPKSSESQPFVDAEMDVLRAGLQCCLDERRSEPIYHYDRDLLEIGLSELIGCVAAFFRRAIDDDLLATSARDAAAPWLAVWADPGLLARSRRFAWHVQAAHGLPILGSRLHGLTLLALLRSSRAASVAHANLTMLVLCKILVIEAALRASVDSDADPLFVKRMLEAFMHSTEP